jgi:hypothetical protein
MSYRRPVRPGGLPSAPGSRHGGAQSTEDDQYKTQNSDVLSRRLRSQKSVAALSNPRAVSRAPSLPASVRRRNSISSSSSSFASTFDSERIERDDYGSSRSSIDVNASDRKGQSSHRSPGGLPSAFISFPSMPQSFSIIFGVE